MWIELMAIVRGVLFEDGVLSECTFSWEHLIWEGVVQKGKEVRCWAEREGAGHEKL